MELNNNHLTDIAKKFMDTDRMRSQSYRGSLLVTTCSTNGKAIAEVGSNIFVAPISYTSSLKSIKLYCEVGINHKINVGIARIDGDKIIPIKKDLFGYYTMQPANAKPGSSLLTLKYSPFTVQELLSKYCTSSAEKSEFEKSKNQKYGFLMLNIANINNTGLGTGWNSENNNIVIDVQYVDNTLSASR